MSLTTIIKRPQDCSSELKEIFIKIVLAGEEMNEKRVRYSIPYTDALVFTGSSNIIMGVGALLHPRQSFHKHLFEMAGKPEMYNPYSVESCWISVLPEYRGKGVWAHNRQTRLEYLGNRPHHSVRRADNKNVVNPDKETQSEQVGHSFVSHIGPDELLLFATNHDPVFDPEKRLYYR